MNIILFIAGIADPKWPVPNLAQASDESGIRDEQATVLSPFDEAALEIALKLRDADPQTRITLAVVAPDAGERLARTVAAFRPDQLFHVNAASLPLWDPVRSMADFKEVAARAGPPADLVLMGREFGDLDDGTLPVALAEHLGMRFAGLVQQVVASDGELQLMREDGAGEQWLTLRPAVFATVTNDRGNRLRHPLLKNVMAAKRAPIASIVPGSAPHSSSLVLTAATRHEPPARTVACRMLDGPVEIQAALLADELDARRRASKN
jgi:electron transfer flavoprotein beta subunit